MSCFNILLYIIAAFLIARLIWSAIMRSNRRREIDRIIKQGEGSFERIEIYISILNRDPAPTRRDLVRLQKLRVIRENMRRGVKRVSSRIIDPPKPR